MLRWSPLKTGHCVWLELASRAYGKAGIQNPEPEPETEPEPELEPVPEPKK